MVDLTNPSLDAEKDLKVTSDQGQPLCQVDEASKILDSQLSVMSMDAGSEGDEKEKVCGPGFHIGDHVSALSPFILNSVTLPQEIYGLRFHSWIDYGIRFSPSYGPRREETCLRGVRQSETQTRLLSYRD